MSPQYFLIKKFGKQINENNQTWKKGNYKRWLVKIKLKLESRKENHRKEFILIKLFKCNVAKK